MGGLGVSEFVAGGLIALTASALATAGTYWIERGRWQREDKRRFQQERLQAYTRFLSAVYVVALMPEGASHRDDPTLLQNVSNGYAELQILASKPVREAAYHLSQAVVIERQPDEPWEVYHNRRMQAMRSKVDPFRDAAQEELNMPVPDTEQMPLPE